MARCGCKDSNILHIVIERVAHPWESVAKQISLINMQMHARNEDFQTRGMILYRNVVRKIWLMRI